MNADAHVETAQAGVTEVEGAQIRVDVGERLDAESKRRGK